jgi:ABC-type uncharacterized transport system ATPase subunit
MDAIRMIGIVKCFGPVRANDGIDLIVDSRKSTAFWVRTELVRAL